MLNTFRKCTLSPEHPFPWTSCAASVSNVEMWNRMFGFVMAIFLDYFCLFREGKLNKCRVGWLHPEIMQAACKVKKEKPDGEATLSCLNALHTG